MARRLLPDSVWQHIEAVLPQRQPGKKGGRPPLGDREALTGIVFVLRTGIPWEELPEELGCGCGMTCLRRLRQWQREGYWEPMVSILRSHLRHSRRINWNRTHMETGVDREKRIMDNSLRSRVTAARLRAREIGSSEFDDVAESELSEA